MTLPDQLASRCIKRGLGSSIGATTTIKLGIECAVCGSSDLSAHAIIRKIEVNLLMSEGYRQK
jgi:hypothetical protein